MRNASFSEKPSEFSASLDDIPEALRETVGIEHRPRQKWSFLRWGLAGLAIALIGGTLPNLLSPSSAPPAAVALVQAQAGIQTAFVQTGVPMTSDFLLGHFAYEEAPPNTLQAISADSRIKLRHPAAQRFLDMAAAARADGVMLIPVSGFRSVHDQEAVFFGLQAQRGERPAQRAEVSAPPGYSEHHTGYAVDLLDGSRPDTDLNPIFETTPAFRWLQYNAVRFNFELSFPRGNPQGVSYEPWHWRFVGDRTSLETFYKARATLSRNSQ